MNSEEYQITAELFERAIELPHEKRAAWIQQQCADNPSRAQIVLSMLIQDDSLEKNGDGDRLFAFSPGAVQLPSPDHSDPPETVASGETANEKVSSEQHFGNYKLLEEIGRGSMGVVYRAEQNTPKRTVALKTIRAGCFASNSDIQRFSNESHATAKLDHENIVPVFEVGCENGAHFYSMQWVEGSNLSEELKSGELNRNELLGIFGKICKAVAHCHENGILHRDLKPSNILLDQNKNPKVSDFGLARNLDSDSTLTAFGDVMGTPGYMAPELAEGRASATSNKTVDVYSLGAILYHILTGRPPILASDVNLMGAIQLIRDHDVVSARIFDRKIHRDLEIICSKCLEKDPTRRYVDAGELFRDLSAHLDGEPIQARGLNLSRRIIRWAKHKPGLAVSWLAISLILGWHFINYYVLGITQPSIQFHWYATMLAGIWAFGAWAFQRTLLFFGGRSLILFAWASMDVIMLSLLLAIPGMDGANSHLVFAFFPIVAASSLRMRMDLVSYVTLLSIAAYLAQVARNNMVDTLTEIFPSTYVTFPLCIATLGLIQYFSLRRSQFAVESFRKKSGGRRFIAD